MAKRMTRRDARKFQKRWRLVARAELSELRSTSMTAKFRQLAALMASALALRWETTKPEEVEAVRARWVRLARQRRA